MQRGIAPKTIAALAMLTALSFVSVVISKVIPNVAGFLSYEPKDAVIAIAGFIYGPLASVAVSVLTSLLEMVSISSTGIYGFLMNVVATLSFVLPAVFIYRAHRSQGGALGGLALGVVCMTLCMLAWNYVITPYYMGVPREQVAGMLATVFLPFNLVKGGLNAGITLLLYKPVVSALRKYQFAEPSHGAGKGFHLSFTLFGFGILVTFVLLLLVMLGVL